MHQERLSGETGKAHKFGPLNTLSQTRIEHNQLNQDSLKRELSTKIFGASELDILEGNQLENSSKTVSSALSDRTKGSRTLPSMLKFLFEIRFALIENINHQIFEIADRNQAYSCNYPHFLMLFALTLQEIQLVIAPSPRISTIIQYVVQKLQHPLLKQQIKENHYYDFMSVMLKREAQSIAKVHDLMEKILREQRTVGVAVFPYYFNLFALVVNKQVLFLRKDRRIVEYSIEYEHEAQYNEFSRQDIKKEWKQLEKRILERYHCQEP